MKRFFEKLIAFMVVLLCFNVSSAFASEYDKSVLVSNEQSIVMADNPQDTTTIKVSENRSETMLLKIHTGHNGKISTLVNRLGKEELILVAIVGALLVLLDPIVEKIIKRFTKVDKSIHILRILFPAVIYKIVCIGCFLVDETAFTKFFINGFRIKPVENTVMNWILQINICVFIVLSIITIYNLFRSYNLITSIIKVIESYILYIILSIVVVLVGMNVIAILVCIVLSMFIFSTLINAKSEKQ